MDTVFPEGTDVGSQNINYLYYFMRLVNDDKASCNDFFIH